MVYSLWCTNSCKGLKLPLPGCAFSRNVAWRTQHAIAWTKDAVQEVCIGTISLPVSCNMCCER